MKRKVLLELIEEVQDQLSMVEPHGDAEEDCVGKYNADTLLHYLRKYAEG